MVNGGVPRLNLLRSVWWFVFVIFLTAPLSAQHADAQTARVPDALKSGLGSGLDSITFSNGDQLTGKLVKVLAGLVTFHSDILGDVTVPLVKVKAMHAGESFAVVGKDEHFTRRTAERVIPVGPIALEDGEIRIGVATAGVPTASVATTGVAKTAADAPVETTVLPAKTTYYVIDSASFHRELRGESDFRYGWNGTATLGASLVTGTNTAQTYTGSVAFVRAIPTIPWLPSNSKTTVNLSATYGLAKDQEVISNGNVFQAASVTKTDIKHGDAEYDKYFSSEIFGLVNANADHNFGNGLELQQADGAGVGWSVIKSPNNVFDLKASLQYEQQEFYNGLYSGLGTPAENLVGAAITESWNRTLAHAVKLNEYVTLSPTFNLIQAYSGVGHVSLVFPVYRKLSFSLASTDNYLGDPPQGYLRNTFQFTAGMTFTLK